jgi:hypothetical protein
MARHAYRSLLRRKPCDPSSDAIRVDSLVARAQRVCVCCLPS